MKIFVIAAICATFPISGWADAPEILTVEANKNANGWTFAVTLKHADTGWDHYADGWEILDQSGNQLGLRVLAHPHVNEQPFTRSLAGVDIPEGINAVNVRTRDSVDGWSSSLFTVPLKR